MRWALCISVCWAVWACPNVAGTAAQAALATPQQIAAYTQAPEAERIRILIQLSKTGGHDLAEELLLNYPLTGQHAANRTLFVKGLISKARGDLEGASSTFRSALASDPSLTLVRSELAQTLYLLNEDDSAKHHLKLLLAESRSDKVAKQLQDFIDHIDQRRPFRFNAFIAAAPTTNLNNGSRKDTVAYIDPLTGLPVLGRLEDPEKSLGVAFGGNASYLFELNERLSAIVAGSVEARVYEDKEYDIVALNQIADLRYAIEGGYFSLGMGASEVIDVSTKELRQSAIGPRLGLRKALGPNDSFSLSASYEWRGRELYRDIYATAFALDGKWTHAFDSTLYTTISFGYDKVTEDIDYHGYRALSAGVEVYKELPHGITVDTSIELQNAVFDDLFPLLWKTREDNRVTTKISLTKRDLNIFGFAPSAEYTFTYNDSNIPVYDYDIHEFDLRLTKDF